MIPGHQLIGARRPVLEGRALEGRSQVGRMPAEELATIWTRCTSAIVKYGFAIEYRDLEPPRTGIFDGRRLVIDPDVGFEMQCFVLLHLFGHSVQWVAPSIEHQLAALTETTEKTAFMRVLHDYEYAAGGFGLQLMHQVGLTELDTWFSDFVATDWKYVERFYDEGRIPPWEECLIEGAPRIEPVAIPPLVHRDVQVRYAF